MATNNTSSNLASIWDVETPRDRTARELNNKYRLAPDRDPGFFQKVGNAFAGETVTGEFIRAVTAPTFSNTGYSATEEDITKYAGDLDRAAVNRAAEDSTSFSEFLYETDEIRRTNKRRAELFSGGGAGMATGLGLTLLAAGGEAVLLTTLATALTGGLGAVGAAGQAVTKAHRIKGAFRALTIAGAVDVPLEMARYNLDNTLRPRDAVIAVGAAIGIGGGLGALKPSLFLRELQGMSKAAAAREAAEAARAAGRNAAADALEPPPQSIKIVPYDDQITYVEGLTRKELFAQVKEAGIDITRLTSGGKKVPKTNKQLQNDLFNHMQDTQPNVQHAQAQAAKEWSALKDAPARAKYARELGVSEKHINRGGKTLVAEVTRKIAEISRTGTIKQGVIPELPKGLKVRKAASIGGVKVQFKSNVEAALWVIGKAGSKDADKIKELKVWLKGSGMDDIDALAKQFVKDAQEMAGKSKSKPTSEREIAKLIKGDETLAGLPDKVVALARRHKDPLKFAAALVKLQKKKGTSLGSTWKVKGAANHREAVAAWYKINDIAESGRVTVALDSKGMVKGLPKGSDDPNVTKFLTDRINELTSGTTAKELKGVRGILDRVIKMPKGERIQKLVDEGVIVFRGIMDENRGHRPVVIIKIGGKKLALYRSSKGTSGKLKGGWHPFFGVNAKGGWLIKGSIGGKSKAGIMRTGNKDIDDIIDILNVVMREGALDARKGRRYKAAGIGGKSNTKAGPKLAKEVNEALYGSQKLDVDVRGMAVGGTKVRGGTALDEGQGLFETKTPHTFKVDEDLFDGEFPRTLDDPRIHPMEEPDVTLHANGKPVAEGPADMVRVDESALEGNSLHYGITGHGLGFRETVARFLDVFPGDVPGLRGLYKFFTPVTIRLLRNKSELTRRFTDIFLENPRGGGQNISTVVKTNVDRTLSRLNIGMKEAIEQARAQGVNLTNKDIVRMLRSGAEVKGPMKIAVDALRKFNSELLKYGKEGGLFVEGIPQSSTYFHRAYNTTMFTKLVEELGEDNVVDFFSRAIRSHKSSLASKLTDEQSKAVAKRIVEFGTNPTGARDWRGTQFMLDKLRKPLIDEGIPEDQVNDMIHAIIPNLENQPHLSYGRRRIDLDETFTGRINGRDVHIDEFFDNDILSNTTRYAQRIIGGVEVQKGVKALFGKDKNMSIADILVEIEKQALKNGDDARFAKQAVEHVYNSLTGLPIYNNPELMKWIMGANSFGQATIGMTLGFAQIPEMASIVMRSGVKASLQQIPGIKELATIFTLGPRDLLKGRKGLGLQGLAKDDLAATLETFTGIAGDYRRGDHFMRRLDELGFDDDIAKSGFNRWLDYGRQTAALNPLGIMPMDTFLRRWAVRSSFQHFVNQAYSTKGGRAVLNKGFWNNSHVRFKEIGMD
jgi:hypothetical protein